MTMIRIQRRRTKLFMGNKHYVYILQCKDDSLYTGYTVNIDERIKLHEEGKGAKYTRGRGPFHLVYQESFATKSEAMQREYEIKTWSRAKKLALINEKESI